MRRLYEAAAYDPSWPKSHWRARHPAPPPAPPLTGEVGAEVVVIGAGYAGLNAALELASGGTDVVVLDAAQPGWGASGRNGGFCSPGGSKLGHDAIVARVGLEGARDFRRYQIASIAHVGALLDRHGIDARQGPPGEAILAHSPRAYAGLRDDATTLRDLYGERPDLVPPEEMRTRGLAGPGFHGAMLIEAGFALDPMAYVEALARLAAAAGARIHGASPVTGLQPAPTGGWRLGTPTGTVTAGKVLIATNGYTCEDLPDWIAGRSLPTLSSILVTRPLDAAERAAQGYTDTRMAFDSRQLLHYFRHLPDGRFLFGMRGGTSASPAAERATLARVRQHFEALFPAWSGAETEHSWSGFVCLTGSLAPFVGPVPGAEGLYAAFGWHGSGVSAASHSGLQIARLMAGRPADIPALIAAPPPRFPFARWRRLGLALAYARYNLKDGPLPA